MPEVIRRYEAGGMTPPELERARRELRASLALARLGSPACAPIVAQLNAVEAELAEGGAS